MCIRDSYRKHYDRQSDAWVMRLA
ncbi:DUF1480 family protein [Klebsiella pneumoniae]|nr:hypothetical protein DZ695_30610 [Klebsiella pneumoniae]